MRRCTPISFKPPKCNHVVFIKSKWWMARWNNKMLWMACCWLTIIESPSSTLPSVAFLSLSLSGYFPTSTTFKPCQGERIGRARDWGQRRETEQVRTQCASKTHLVGITNMPQSTESTTWCWRAITDEHLVSKSPTAVLDQQEGDDTRGNDVPWLTEPAARA